MSFLTRYEDDASALYFPAGRHVVGLNFGLAEPDPEI